MTCIGIRRLLSSLLRKSTRDPNRGDQDEERRCLLTPSTGEDFSSDVENSTPRIDRNSITSEPAIQDVTANVTCPIPNWFDDENIRDFSCSTTTTIIHGCMEQGCRICKFLENCYSSYHRGRHDAINITYVRNKKLSVLLVENAHIKGEELDILGGSENHNPWGLGVQPGILQPVEERVAPFVKKCYDHCLTSHKRCRRQASTKRARTAKQPARLIDVGTPSRPPSLVEVSESSNHQGHSMKYTALSHCWGEQKFVTTTTATILLHKECIAWDSLPETFQHAILVTRSLDVKFLWIDSLCIIQDSPEDWAKESSKMADIYSNSYITIAATRATNSVQGLFFKGLPIKSVSESEQTPPLEIYVRNAIDHLPFDKGDLPLMKRGWALQERFLSPRVIHFTEEELVWDCEESIECECQGCGRENNARQRFPNLDESETITPNTSADWISILDQYCSCILTYDQDALVALSGVAERFEKWGVGQYLAGLWERDLPHNLLWFKEFELGERHDVSQISKWSPPSWTWCSVRGWKGESRDVSMTLRWIGHLFHSDKFSSCHAQVINASCYPSTSDPRGMVSGGHLTLRAKLVPFKLNFLGDRNETEERKARRGFSFCSSQFYKFQRIESKMTRDGGEPQATCERDTAPSCLASTDYVVHFLPDVPLLSKSEQMEDGETVYFLHIRRTATINTWKLEAWDDGIILRSLRKGVDDATLSLAQSRGLGDDVYRRVGYAALGDGSRNSDLEVDGAYPVKTITIF